MNIVLKKEGKELVAEVQGRIDTLTAREFEEKLIPEIETIDKLTLDLKELEYITSAGLRVILILQKQLADREGLIIKNVCEEVMEVFEITGFSDVLTIE